MDNVFKEARDAFKPLEIKVIFLAESPPDKPNRFFYFPDVSKGDSLFLHLIREVFPELKKEETKQLRARKEELLIRFRDAGYWVFDSSENTLLKSLHTVLKSVSRLKKGFPTINFIIINNNKNYYGKAKRGNRFKIKQNTITKCNK